MKVRDSGMPEEAYWESLFDIPLILDSFAIGTGIGDVVEFGCGYGTFTVPVARRISGLLHALDIEPDMVRKVAKRCRREGLSNVRAEVRDVIEQGTGLGDSSMDFVLLFNLLHHDQPLVLLREAFRVLKPSGRLAVIHWVHDPATPRGPDLSIRPRPEQCIAWGKEAGFVSPPQQFDLKPYHYGLLFRRPPVALRRGMVAGRPRRGDDDDPDSFPMEEKACPLPTYPA
jgi:SAM-dependent methyltransferase